MAMDLSDACTMQQDQQVNEAADLAIVWLMPIEFTYHCN
tara:strand:+ start:8360 stop:8476 length:117 start_codon:yes stop_codon:yes gene_type:complete